MARKVCGDCKFYQVKDVCPKIEYKDSKLNRAACLSSDTACRLFQPKYKKTLNEELEMSEALELLNKHIYKCPIDTENVLVYNDGIYEKAKPLIWKILESEYEDDLKRHFVDESYAHLQRANTIRREKINQYINKIPIKNGLFNLLTREIEAFDSEQVFTYKLNVIFNPEADCPNFKQFLKEILYEEDIPLLQEIMGYCLLPAMPYHKMFWLYGTGRNGKGVVIRTQEYVLGKENCATLNLSEFRESRRFSLSQLYGKLLNTSSEPPLSKYGLPTTVLKMVTGEDTIRAELKGKNERLVFTNIAKMLVLGNHFPKVEDNSLGWWDRVIVLNFPNSFEGEKQVPNIEKRWIPKEINGIFNWMLEGLYRINQNNGFSSSKSTEETKAEFMRVSDPFNAWLNDCIFFVGEAFLTRQEAYESYKEYNIEIGSEPDSQRTFYSKMRQTPRVKDTQTRVKGKVTRIFQGLTFKKVESVADVTDVAGLHTQESRETSKSSRVYSPVTSATSATPIVNLDKAFTQKVCFDCRRILTDDTPHTFYEEKPICFTCFNQIEAQKKKEDWKCPQLTTLDDSPFCKILQSILAMPEQCKPDCSLLEKEASE